MNNNLENKKEEIKENVPFSSGEKGFAVFWLLFGGFFLWRSLLLYQEHPGLSSCAALPLFCSGVIVLCALIILVSDRKAKTPNSGKSLSVQLKQTLKNIFPSDIMVTIVLILLYCIALYMGLGFYVATPIFLWISMCWFMRNKFMINGFDKSAFAKIAVKNLIWTVICILFILVLFTYLFSVVLP